MKKTKEKRSKEQLHLEVHILRIERKIMATIADVNAALAQLAADVATLKSVPPAATAADLDGVVSQIQTIDAAVKPAA